MRLYYFTTAEHGLMTIRDRRLKVSEIDKVNDPYEFLALDLSDQFVRDRFLAWKYNDLSKNRGIICFSRAWTHPLMWGHYAEKHKGICLGFDVADSLVSKVKYTSRRIKLSKSEIDEKIMSGNEQFIHDLIEHKYSAWRYEREYRVLCSLDEPDPVNGYHFVNFSNKIVLREVIVGAFSSVSIDRVKRVLQSPTRKIRIIKAALSGSKFAAIVAKSEYAPSPTVPTGSNL